MLMTDVEAGHEYRNKFTYKMYFKRPIDTCSEISVKGASQETNESTVVVVCSSVFEHLYVGLRGHSESILQAFK